MERFAPNVPKSVAELTVEPRLGISNVEALSTPSSASSPVPRTSSR